MRSARNANFAAALESSKRLGFCVKEISAKFARRKPSTINCAARLDARRRAILPRASITTVGWGPLPNTLIPKTVGTITGTGFWDYGTGDIGNDGIHQIDVARWGLGVDLPHAISSSGGQLFYDDDHETPDTQNVTYEYDDCYLIYEMRLWTDYKMEGHDNGVVFYGDKGRLEIGRQGCIVTYIDGEPKKIGDGSDLDANIRNFLECVKNNTPGKLNAPIHEGFYSASLSHFGNIGTRVDRKLKFDRDAMKFKNDEEADRLLSRTYREGYEFPTL